MLKVAFAPTYIHPLSPDHHFPMLKYELLPAQLLSYKYHFSYISALNSYKKGSQIFHFSKKWNICEPSL